MLRRSALRQVLLCLASVVVLALVGAGVIGRGGGPSAGALHAVTPRPSPVTGSGGGIVPPSEPAQNIPPSPNFLANCQGAYYDDSTGCVGAVVQAIDNAREHEGLAGMTLPTNWYQLSPDDQMFVATNLERTARGLPALSGLASALDQASQAAASRNADPSPPNGYPWSAWGGNWAGAMGNPLEAMYYWMYDDGLGSSNIDCTPQNTSGCWGHRNNVLLEMTCQPCLMGAGLDATAWQGYPSWTELLVDTTGGSALDYSWSQVVAYLPSSSANSGLSSPAVGIAATPDGQGYWLVASDGGVFSFGDAHFYGSMGGTPLAAPVVGIASTPDGHGYWLVGSDGGLFAFGDAAFYGSMGGHPLVDPVVGIATTPGGHGYWEVASDGGMFSFGDARFYGSMGGHPLDQPVVGMAPTHDGRGYWLVASDGGMFSFGDAPFFGSMGGTPLFRPVVSMAPTPDGRGYWITASDGGIFSFGDAAFRGSTGGHVLNAPVVSMAAPSNAGYWLAAADGGIFSFGVPFHGSMG